MVAQEAETVDTKAGESEEVKIFAVKHKIKVETVRKSKTQIHKRVQR